MKKSIGLMVLASGLMSSLALAEHSSDEIIDMATDVKVHLVELADIALLAGDRASMNQNYQREQALDEISESSQELAQHVHKQVIRDIKKGERFPMVRRSLQRMQHSFDDLEQKIDYLRGPLIKEAHEKVEHELRKLKRALSGSIGGGRPIPPTPGGNIRATCQGKYGGNFFNKKTSVRCTLLGRGAVSYEVQFYNRETGQQASYSQSLNPGQQRQEFTTENVYVGRAASFSVIVRFRNGGQQVVANGVATGNPF